MRNIVFGENEYYHICNRGLNRQILFRDKMDYIRFIFLILYFQFPIKLHNISQAISSFLKRNRFGVEKINAKTLARSRQIEVLAFVLMPNHFHILIKNIEEHSVSAYMQRILMAYGKYYNEKYKRTGHVFDGPYRCTHIENNKQLLYASCYIHKNPLAIKDHFYHYDEYPYSSYQDYLNNNRWQNLLKTDVILSQFKNPVNYKNFVVTSIAEEEDSSFYIN